MIEKAIEKAAKNGLKLNEMFDLPKYYFRYAELESDNDIEFVFECGLGDNYDIRKHKNIYEFIFNKEIGFIDKLVGEKEVCISYGRGCLQPCGLISMLGKSCYSVGGAAWCGERTPLATHHRSQLANMTLDEMKFSIRDLAK